MADIVLPVPGENPNWGSKLNTAILRINQELESLGARVSVAETGLSSVTLRVTNLEGRVNSLESGLEDQVRDIAADVIASDPTVIAAAEAAVDDALADSGLVRFGDPAIPEEGIFNNDPAYLLREADEIGHMTRGVRKNDGAQVMPRADIDELTISGTADVTAGIGNGYAFTVTDSQGRVSELAIDEVTGEVPQWILDRWALRMGTGGAGSGGWDIVIAAGQSNSGEPDTPLTGIYTPDPMLLKWTGGSAALLDGDMGSIAPEFARAFRHTPHSASNRPAIAVRVGAGGTGFTTTSISPAPTGYKTGAGTWDRNLTSDPQNYVVQLLATARAIRSAAPAGSRIIILWSQGEVDGRTDNPPYLSRAEYAAKLDDLIGHVRSELGDAALPWIIGSTNPDWYVDEQARRDVCEALATTPQRVEHTAYVWGPVGMYDRDTSDVHWSAQGQMYRAREMATEGFTRALVNVDGAEPAAVQNLTARRSGDDITIEWDRPLSRVDTITAETSSDGTTWTPAQLDVAHGARATTTASGPQHVRVRLANSAGAATAHTTI